MSHQILALTDYNTSKSYAMLTLATARIHTNVYLSNEYLSLKLHNLPVSSNFNSVNKIVYNKPYQTMIASEKILAKDWNQPDEDEAWLNL